MRRVVREHVPKSSWIQLTLWYGVSSCVTVCSTNCLECLLEHQYAQSIPSPKRQSRERRHASNNATASPFLTGNRYDNCFYHCRVVTFARWRNCRQNTWTLRRPCFLQFHLPYSILYRHTSGKFMWFPEAGSQWRDTDPSLLYGPTVTTLRQA